MVMAKLRLLRAAISHLLHLRHSELFCQIFSHIHALAVGWWIVGGMKGWKRVDSGKARC